MDKLSVDEVCRLVKVCARFGVREFSLGNLTFKLGQEPNTFFTPSSATGKSEAVEQDYVNKQEIKMKEDELATMLVTDPLAYEQLMEQGDLEHGEENNGSEHALSGDGAS